MYLDINLDIVSKLMMKIVTQVVNLDINLDIVFKLMVLQMILMIKIQDHIGNYELLNLSKTAFLCSRKVPASAVLKCYDWSIVQREAGNCIISGFHSKLEKDVLHFLLKGNQPIILALARGLKERIEPEFQQAIEQGRLLIITPFSEEVKRVTEQTAAIRNKMMIDLADKIAVGHIAVGGLLDELLKQTNKSIIKIE